MHRRGLSAERQTPCTSSDCLFVGCMCVLARPFPSFLYSPKRANDRASLNRNTAPSTGGSGLHPLAYRRKWNRLLAARWAGIRLLLLLLALARAPTDITPVLGRDALPAPGVRGWPRDGRSVHQPRRWSQHVMWDNPTSASCTEISDRRGQAHENRTGSPRSLLLQLLPSVSSHYAMSPGSTRLQNHV